MDESFFRMVAAQLRKPVGDADTETARRMNEGNRNMNLKTIEHIEPADNDRILEIGMGNGFFVKDILENNKTVNYTGCDYSEDMVKQSEELNRDFVQQGRAAFYTCDAENLPFEGNVFNKLFTINTIYFWNDPAAVIKEFSRVLIIGGLFIITIRPKWFMQGLPVVNYGFSLYTNEDIQDLVERNGFKFLVADEYEDLAMGVEGKEIKAAFTVIKCQKK